MNYMTCIGLPALGTCIDETAHSGYTASCAFQGWETASYQDPADRLVKLAVDDLLDYGSSDVDALHFPVSRWN